MKQKFANKLAIYILRFALPFLIFSLYLWWQYRTFHDPDDPYDAGTGVYYFVTFVISTLIGIAAFTTALSVPRLRFSGLTTLGLLFGSLSVWHFTVFLDAVNGDNFFRMDMMHKIVIALPVLCFILNLGLFLRNLFRG